MSKFYLLILLMISNFAYSYKINQDEFEMIVEFHKLNTGKRLFYKNLLDKDAYDCNNISGNPDLVFNGSGFKFREVDGVYRVFTLSPILRQLSRYGYGGVFYPGYASLSMDVSIEFPPKFFETFPYLEKIYLTGCNLKTVPDELFKAKNLKILNFDSNPIEEISEELGNLTNLTSLTLSRTKLKELPKSIKYLNKLNTLKLDNTQLQSIPKEFGELKALHVAFLYDLSLTSIDKSVFNLSNLLIFDLPEFYKENSIVEISMWGQNSDILDYLPLNTEIISYTGQNIGAGIVTKNVGNKCYLQIEDWMQYNNFFSSNEYIVIKYKCPQGVFYKAYTTIEDADLGNQEFSMLNLESESPISSDYFMPANIDLQVDKIDFGVGEIATPTINFSSVPDTSLINRYKSLVRYRFSNSCAFKNRQGKIEGRNPGKVRLYAYSGFVCDSIDLNINTNVTKVEIKNPDIYVVDGLKTLTMYKDSKVDFNVEFTPSIVADKGLTFKPIKSSINDMPSAKIGTDSEYTFGSMSEGFTLIEVKANVIKCPSDTILLNVIPKIGSIDIVGDFTPIIDIPLTYNVNINTNSKIASIQWKVNNSRVQITNFSTQLDPTKSDFGVCEITPKRTGVCRLTCIVTDQLYNKYQYTINISPKAEIYSVSNIQPSTIPVGESKNLTYTYASSKANNNLLWESSDPSALRIINTSNPRKLIAQKTGKYQIYTTLENGSKITQDIDIIKEVESCTLRVDTKARHGDIVEYQDLISVYPADATDKSITWQVKQYDKNVPWSSTTSDKSIVKYDAAYHYYVDAYASNGKRCVKIRPDGRAYNGKINTYHPITDVKVKDEVYGLYSTAYVTSIDVTSQDKTSNYNKLVVKCTKQEGPDGSIIDNYKSFSFDKNRSGGNKNRLNNYCNYLYGKRASSCNVVDDGDSYIVYYFKSKRPGKYTFSFATEDDPINILDTAQVIVEDLVRDVKIKLVNLKDYQKTQTDVAYAAGDTMWYEFDLGDYEKRHFFPIHAKVLNNNPDYKFSHDIVNSKGYCIMPKVWGRYYIDFGGYNDLGMQTFFHKTKYFRVSQFESYDFSSPDYLPTYENYYVRIANKKPTNIPRAYRSYGYQVLDVKYDDQNWWKYMTGTWFRIYAHKKTDVYYDTWNRYLMDISHKDTTYQKHKLRNMHLEPVDTIIFGLDKTYTVLSTDPDPYLSEVKWTTSATDNSIYDKTSVGYNKIKIDAKKQGWVNINAYDYKTKLSANTKLYIVPPISGITLRNDTIEAGNSKYLSCNIQPSNAGIKRLKWEIIGDAHGCTVDNNGYLTASNEANYILKIKANSVDGSNTVSNTIDVFVYRRVAKINVSTIDGKSNYDKNTSSIALKAEVLPVDASIKDIEWKVSRFDLAAISNTGVMTPKGSEGQVIVTVEAKDGSKVKTSIPINIITYAQSVNIESKDTIVCGISDMANATVLPIQADQSYTWGSLDNSIATISNNGIINPLKSGEVEIFAQTLDQSGVKGTKKIYVFDKASTVSIVGGDRFQESDFIKFDFNITPTTALQEVNWTVEQVDNGRQQAVVSIDKSGKLMVNEPGWVKVVAETFNYGSLITVVRDEMDVLILPDVSGNISLDVQRDSISLNQDEIPFIYDITGINSKYFTLNIDFFDIAGSLYETNNSFIASPTIKQIDPIEAGVIKFDVKSSLVDDLIYLTDSVFIGEDTAEVAYDTLVLGNKLKLSKAVDHRWEIVDGDAVDFESGSDMMIIAEKLGDVVLHYLDKDDHIKKVDSLHVAQPVTQIILSPKNLEFKTTEKVGVKAQVLPTNAYSKELSWRVFLQPDQISVVENDSILIGNNENTIFKVVAFSTDGSHVSDTALVEFYKEIDSVKIKETEYVKKPVDTIMVGDELYLSCNHFPSDAKYKAIKWKCSNSSVLKIENEDSTMVKLTGLYPTYSNNVVVKVESLSNPDATDSIEICVILPVEEIEINAPNRIYITENFTDTTIVNSVLPNSPNSSNENLVWESFNTSIIEIVNPSIDGKTVTLRAKKPGRVRIRAKATDGSNIYADKYIDVYKYITSIDINPSREIVEFFTMKEVVDFDWQINDDAYTNNLKWNIYDKANNPVSVDNILLRDGDYITINNSILDTVIVEVIANDSSKTPLTVKDTIGIRQLVTSIDISDVQVEYEPDYVYLTESMQLTCKVYPENAYNKSVNWSIDTSNVVKEAGLETDTTLSIKGDKKGYSIITVSPKDSSGVEQIKFVQSVPRMERIEITVPDTIFENSSFELNPVMVPAGAEVVQYKYKFYVEQTGTLVELNDTSIVDIYNGNQMFFKDKPYKYDKDIYLGITAIDKFNDSIELFGLTDSPKIYIGNNADRIDVDISKPEIYVGQTTRITAHIKPKYADIRKIEWYSVEPRLGDLIYVNDTVVDIVAKSKGEYVFSPIVLDSGDAEANESQFVIRQQMYDFKLYDYDTVNVGDTLNYFINHIVPDDADDRNVVWSIYKIDGVTQIIDPNYAMVNSTTGIVYPKELSAGHNIIVKAITTDGFNTARYDTVRVFKKVSSVNVTGADRIPLGQFSNYNSAVLPHDADNDNLKVSIDNGESARLTIIDNYNYRLNAQAEGFVNISVETTDGSGIKEEKLVEIYKPVSSINTLLSGSSQYLPIGHTKEILSITKPMNTNTELHYRIIGGSDKVKLSGKSLTGLSEGTAFVEIEAQDFGKVKDTIEVEVIIPVKSVKLSHPNRLIAVNEQENIDIEVLPENATIKELRFFVTQDNVIFEENGVVTALDTGKVKISASTIDGTYITASIDMQVYIPIKTIDLTIDGIDKQFIPSSNSGYFEGKQIVTGDTVNFYYTIFPPYASFKDLDFKLPNSLVVNSKLKDTDKADAVVEFVSTDLSLDKIVATSKDPKAVSKEVEIESVVWVEKLIMNDERAIVPIFGKLNLAPSFTDGIWPSNANNKNLEFWMQDEMAQVDQYGGFIAGDKEAVTCVYVKALDGSGVIDSTKVEIIPPYINLRLKGNKLSLPRKFDEQLIVSTFPENLDYELEVIQGSATIDDDDFIQGNEIGQVVVVAKSKYHHIDIYDTLTIDISLSTIFILDDEMSMKIGDESKVEYINYANYDFWEVDKTSLKDSVVTVDNNGFITAVNYGVATVYVENEVGSRDSIYVKVFLDQKVIDGDLLLYPNPVTENWINIQIEGLEGELDCQVFDMNGEIVLKYKSRTPTFRLDLPVNTRSGRYLLRAYDQKGQMKEYWFIYLSE